ncbi:MAG TPA: dephospho-CoA kinase [Pontiella sp.]
MSEPNSSSIIIGITGGIACGKSEVGRILERMGFLICDADHVAHELMRKGSSVYSKIVECFGEQILSESGEIYRPAFGRLIFKDPVKREKLNLLVHPAVRNALGDWIANARKQRSSAAVMVPLLFESGMQDLDFNAVICVSSSIKDMERRMIDRGLTLREARQRIDSQMPLTDKEQLADFIILNNETLEDLELTTRKTVEAIIGER